MTKLYPFYKLTVLCYQYSDSTGNDNDTDSLDDYIQQKCTNNNALYI